MLRKIILEIRVATVSISAICNFYKHNFCRDETVAFVCDHYDKKERQTCWLWKSLIFISRFYLLSQTGPKSRHPCILKKRYLSPTEAFLLKCNMLHFPNISWYSSAKNSYFSNPTWLPLPNQQLSSRFPLISGFCNDCHNLWSATC